MVITVAMMASVARMPVSFSFFSSSHSTAMPAAPPATPRPIRPAKPRTPDSTSWCPWLAVMAWNTTTAMMAPIGSMVVPSKPRIVVSFLPVRAACRIGVTTVGPDTIKIAPSMMAALEDRPSSSPPKKPAPAQVIGMPQPRSRRTTRRLSPSSPVVTRSRPPSNKMIATARLTSGGHAAPKILSGLTTVVAAPAANPAGSSKMIAGMPKRAAMIWQATASPTIRASPAKICDAVIGPVPAAAYQPRGYLAAKAHPRIRTWCVSPPAPS